MLISILVQNSPKVTKKVLVFRKVARSCCLTKKLLKILTVAKTVAEQNLEMPQHVHPIFVNILFDKTNSNK